MTCSEKPILFHIFCSDTIWGRIPSSQRVLYMMLHYIQVDNVLIAPRRPITCQFSPKVSFPEQLKVEKVTNVHLENSPLKCGW